MANIQLSAYDSDPEDTPFLREGDQADEPIPGVPTTPRQPQRRLRARPWQARSPSAVVMLVSAAKFCVITSGLLMLMPLYRLIEDAFCHVYYEDDSPGLIDEMKCKVDEVQSSLAFMMAWLGLAAAVMNLIVAYPYGMLSDRIGRKPTMLLAYTGVAVSFSMSSFMMGPLKYAIRENPYTLLVGTLMTLFGGGVPVLLSTMFAVVSDVSSENDKASNFLYLTMGATAGGILGPSLAGLLMERWGPWFPINIVMCIMPFVFVLLLLIPETLTGGIQAQGPRDTGNHPSLLVALRNQVGSGVRDLRSSLKMMKNVNIPLCLVTFFFSNARFTSGSATLVQYISKHFSWTLAETSVLLSPLGVLQLVVLSSLPKLSAVLTSPRFGYTAFGKDLLLSRTSLLIVLVSALVRALSRSIGPFIFGLMIGSFGAAESAVIRATVTNLVDPAYTSRLYALIGIAEIIGSVTGGPILAWCFNKGLEMRGFWTGLPWLYLAFTCLVSWAALLFVKSPEKRLDDDGIGETDEDAFPTHSIRL